MANREIRIFTSREAASWAAATRFEDLARIKTIERKPFAAALSGGSTPKLLYQILGSPTFASRVQWSNVQLFQVDERCVPPDHQQSNYRMIRETLLAGGLLPDTHFHRMQAERVDRERACKEYAREIQSVLNPGPGEWPRFELILLGMGPDGHTASLFSGSPAEREEAAWVCPNYVKKLDMYRLTLTFPVLNAGANVIILVSGEEKAEILREVLEGRKERFPVQNVQPTDGQVSWFLDEDAARLLSDETRG
jgi:6-phosphogluconolactonase